MSFADRHGESCKDEATQRVTQDGLGCFAALAVTALQTRLTDPTSAFALHYSETFPQTPDGSFLAVPSSDRICCCPQAI